MVWCLNLCLVAVPVAIATEPARTHKDFIVDVVKGHDCIVTGRVIKTEKTEIREGVNEVVCHVRVDLILKGEPKTHDMVISEKRFRTVQIRFLHGKQVKKEGAGALTDMEIDPGMEAIWPLPPASKTGVYEWEGRIDLSDLDAVKEQLQNKASLPTGSSPTTSTPTAVP